MSKPITILIPKVCPICKVNFIATSRNKVKKYCAPYCQIKGLVGFKHSEEARKNMSKGKLGKKKPPRSAEHRANLSKAHKGRIVSLETRLKMSISQKGRTATEETRAKMRISQAREKNPAWKGGVSNTNLRWRSGGEYKRWMRAVKKRDGKCLVCGSTNNLEAHHIKSFNEYPELRFVVKNGFTMCYEHHIEFHKKYGNKNNRQQLNAFIKHISARD